MLNHRRPPSGTPYPRAHLNDPPPPEIPLITDAPDHGRCSKPTKLDFGITGGDAEEGHARVVALVALLPYRFNILYIDHVVAGDGVTEMRSRLLEYTSLPVCSGPVLNQTDDVADYFSMM